MKYQISYYNNIQVGFTCNTDSQRLSYKYTSRMHHKNLAKNEVTV